MYVGLTILAIVSIQTYFNVAVIKAKATSNVEREMSSAIALVQSFFSELINRSREDVGIISAHEALNNYFNQANADDFEGMERELQLFETFLSKFLSAKYRYQRLEVFSAYGSVSHFLDGKIAEPSPVTSYDFMQGNFDNLFWAYLTSKDQRIYINIFYRMEGDFDSSGINTSDPLIFVYSDITEEMEKLSDSLNDVGKYLIVGNELGLLYGDIPERAGPQEYLQSSAYFQPLGINIGVKLSPDVAYEGANYAARNAVVLAVLTFMVMSAALYISSRFLIARPLNRLNQFIQKEIIGQQTLSNRFESKNSDEIGTFASGINLMLDQLQHRQAELSSSEARLALALWGSGEGIWSFSYADKKLTLDLLCCRIIGLSESEKKISLFAFYQNIEAQDKARVRAYVQEFRKKQLDIFSLSFGFKRYGGGKIYLQFKGKAVIPDAAHKSLALSGTLQDVTEEQKSKDQIRLYASAYDASNNGILLLDRAFNIIGANTGYTNITGFTYDEVAGVPPHFINSPFNRSTDIADINLQLKLNQYWHTEIVDKAKSGVDIILSLYLNIAFDEQKQISHYVCVMSDITQKKKSEQDLWHRANYDTLTDLPNRVYFRRKLLKAITKTAETKHMVALFFIDLDKFKHVNDAMGHDVGDKLLCQVAEKLQEVTRKSDFVARLGGDEFAILLEDVRSRTSIERIAQQLQGLFTNGLEVEGKLVSIGISIGISLSPADASNVDDLLQCADTAMYCSKSKGTNLYHFYLPQMRDHKTRRNQIEVELKTAIRNQSLALHYQPQINLQDNSIYGFEALARWLHPTLGQISPAEFICVAEETGLITELGRFALNQACQDIVRFQQIGFEQVRVSVNVSARQFLLSDLVADVSQALKANNLDAQSLELELTESLIVEDPDKVMGVLEQLKSMGVRLSIDDFGTGYSSLSYLSQFPLDVLKIDKSFIAQMNNGRKGLALIQSIVAIAKSLDLDIIAEGVESIDDVATLRKLECNVVQGFYYSPALTADMLIKYLNEFYPATRRA